MADTAGIVNTARTSFTTFPEAKQQGDHFVAMPQEQKDGWLHTHARQTILVEPQALFELWADQSGYPRWMEQVVSVTPSADGKQSHWVMSPDPDDAKAKQIEFDSEITEDVPGSKIAWRSISGNVEQHGTVLFAARRDGRGTVVTLEQHFKIGTLANAAAATVHRGPKQTVINNLRHFKQMAEAGEIPSVAGQPHGPRGLAGGIKEWMYGETIPTPPGTSEQA